MPPELILSKGAVSAEVAVALADGIRRRVGSTIGVGITGIAGPGGGTEEKPVGTVFVAISYSGGVKERGLRFPGERDNVRWQASQQRWIWCGSISFTTERIAVRAAQIGGEESLIVRLFVALQIPDPIRNDYSALIDDLRRLDTKASAKKPKWVRPENLHVTLKFIGHTDPGRLDEIRGPYKRSLTTGEFYCIFATSAFFRARNTRASSGAVWRRRKISQHSLTMSTHSGDARLPCRGARFHSASDTRTHRPAGNFPRSTAAIEKHASATSECCIPANSI